MRVSLFYALSEFILDRCDPDIKIVELGKNYGCPGGRNRGIDYCSGDFIFYLDNDGILHERAVEMAYEVVKDDDSIAVVTGIVYDFDDLSEIDTSIMPISFKQYNYTEFQGGICMHRKDIYKTVGMYPDHFVYGGEEWYLAAKILDKELKIIKNESVILWHKKSDFARNRESELLNAYYNKLYIGISLYPLMYAIAFAFYFPFQYNRYAEKLNIGRAYRETFFKRYFRALKTGLRDRKPIKLSAYKNLMNKY